MSLLSERSQYLTESQTLAMAKKCRDLQSKGIDVVNLSIGEPDFDTPDFIKEAATRALKENYTRYTPVPGYLDLRKAISEKFKRDNGLNYNPDQIVVSTGAKQSIANAVLSLVDPGDEVIVPIPFWVSYIEMIKLAGGVPVYIKTTVEDNFKFTAEDLKKTISSKTKLLIFSTPCNPSGSVYSKDELFNISEILKLSSGIAVISDEIYEHINFAGKHESLAQFESIRDRVITVNGVSKGFAMTGWRIGYMGSSLEISQACEKMQGQITSGTCSIAQRAAIAAVETQPEILNSMKESFKKRRDLVLNLLKEIPGVKANIPDGAFYVFPDISSYFGKSNSEWVIKNSEDLCDYLLGEAHVALVSGSAFGDDSCIRISYATSETNLIKALGRLKDALGRLK